MKQATQDQVAQALKARVKQEIMSMYFCFPVEIVRHWSDVVPDPTGEDLGAVLGRAWVKPIHKFMNHMGEIVEMRDIFTVPAPPWMRGPFMMFGGFDVGQKVMVTVSQFALDELIKDRERHHPKYPRHMSSEDAWISSDAFRVDIDPKFPREYLNDFGFMLLDEDFKPLSKFIMRRNKEIRIECGQFTVRAESIDMVDFGGPATSRVGDRDDDDEAKGSDKLIEGSPSMRVADRTSFVPGEITGPVFTEEDTNPKAGG